MAILKDAGIRKEFLRKFNRGIKSHGFYNRTAFNEPEVGLSFKRNLKNDNNVSLIKLAVLDEGDPRRKAIYASVSYGKDRGTSIEIRLFEKIKPGDPIDLEFTNEFYYDPTKNQIYHGTKKISSLALLEEVYRKHIKTTRPLAGLILRLRLWYRRQFLGYLIEALANTAKALLFIISGIRYSYDAFFDGTEYADRIANLHRNEKENTRGGEEKISFLGYKAKRWPILFYCFLHLGIYFFCIVIGFKPYAIVTLLKNNFLTLVYVIVSISFIESVLPDSLKRFIRFLSRLHLRVIYKKITV